MALSRLLPRNGEQVALSCPVESGVLEPWRQLPGADISSTNISVFYFSLLRPDKLTGTLHTQAPRGEAFAYVCVYTHIIIYPLCTLTHRYMHTLEGWPRRTEHTQLLTACTGKWQVPRGAV